MAEVLRPGMVFGMESGQALPLPRLDAPSRASVLPLSAFEGQYPPVQGPPPVPLPAGDDRGSGSGGQIRGPGAKKQRLTWQSGAIAGKTGELRDAMVEGEAKAKQTLASFTKGSGNEAKKLRQLLASKDTPLNEQEQAGIVRYEELIGKLKAAQNVISQWSLSDSVSKLQDMDELE